MKFKDYKGNILLDSSDVTKFSNIKKIVIGTKVLTLTNTSTSKYMFNDSDINNLTGLTGSNVDNTYVNFVNGDAGAQSTHVEGATRVGGTSWYAVFDPAPKVDNIRINYIIIRK